MRKRWVVASKLKTNLPNSGSFNYRMVPLLEVSKELEIYLNKYNQCDQNAPLSCLRLEPIPVEGENVTLSKFKLELASIKKKTEYLHITQLRRLNMLDENTLNLNENEIII